MAMTKVTGGDQAPAWNDPKVNEEFKAGAVLHGFYIEKRVNVGPKNSTIYIVMKEDDEKVAVWGGTVLDGAFDNIKLGAEVKLEYKGKEKSKNGNEFHAYEVSADNEHPNVANFQG